MSNSQTVMIIDDEVHIRALLEQTLEELEDEGVEILLAADGQEGLDGVRAHNPDLIFLDVMMPKLNGYDVCEQLKSDPETKSTYIVMLTAKGQEVDRDRAEQAGADVYATKPFDPNEILDLARRILGLD